MERKGLAEHKVQLLENADLHGSDLGLGVRVVGHVDEIIDSGHVHLLVLGGNEHGSDANQLQLHLGHVHSHQVGVDDLHAQVHGLLQQMELEVDLDEPVDEHRAHLRRHDLLVQEVGRHAELLLHRGQVAVDVLDILGDQLCVLRVVLVNVDDLAVAHLHDAALVHVAALLDRPLLLHDHLLALEGHDLLAGRDLVADVAQRVPAAARECGLGEDGVGGGGGGEGVGYGQAAEAARLHTLVRLHLDVLVAVA